jgi:hypothetical protein
VKPSEIRLIIDKCLKVDEGRAYLTTSVYDALVENLWEAIQLDKAKDTLEEIKTNERYQQDS